MYDTNNIFAKIIRGEIPCNKVYEDAHVLAFRDINPAAPLHILVVPKGNYMSFADFSAKASGEEMKHFFAAVGKIAKEQGVEETGYRLIANHGADASQTVAHFHMHILGGRHLGALVPGDTHHQ